MLSRCRKLQHISKICVRMYGSRILIRLLYLRRYEFLGIGQIRLWQFLLQSLVKGTHGICWTNRDNFEFQFTHPDAVARAWGRCKTKSKMMTFDKMTRSMRDYYKRNILRKVPNHRLMYQFLDENIKVICREMQKSTE